LAIIYGMYLKISIPDFNLSTKGNIFSDLFTEKEEIKNIEVIDENKLLIIIKSDEKIKGAIYDINKNEIIRLIDK